MIDKERETARSFANADLENLDCLLADDPGWKATQSLFVDFHDAARQFKGQAHALTLVQRFEQICSDQYLLLKKLIERVHSSQRKKFLRTAEAAEIVARELRTWRLLSALYADRFSYQPAGSETGEGDEQMDMSSARFISDYDVEKNLVKKSRLYRELKLLKEWTEQTTFDSVATCDTSMFSEKCLLWENSLHLMKTGQKSSGKKLISSFEPDAPLEPGVHLADEDANDEAALLRLLFEFLRTGQKQTAVDVCVHVGQSWRAAMLCGGALTHDPNLTLPDRNFDLGLDPMVDTPDDLPSIGLSDELGEDELKPVEGFPNRELWKKMCWEIVDKPSLPKFERAVLGALSGHLTSLLPVCSTWTDYVWTYSLCGAEYQVASALDAAQHPLAPDWHPFVRNNETDTGGVGFVGSGTGEGDPSVTQCDFTLEEMFAEIDARRSGEKVDQIAEVFHDAQRYAVEENFDIALQKHIQFCSNSMLGQGYRSVLSSPQGAGDAQPVEHVAPLHIIRFMAHYALIVRMFGVDANEFLINNVLELYVKALMEAQHMDLVAEYCAHLPPALHIRLFASMCEPITDPMRRRELVYSASDAGLEVNDICRTIVRNLRKAYCGSMGDLLIRDKTMLSGGYRRNDGPSFSRSFVGSDLDRTQPIGGSSLESSILDSTMAGSALMGEGMKSSIGIVRKMAGNEQVSEADRNAINSIHWLLLDPALRMDAMREANALARTFLMMRNFKCARLLIEELPKDHPVPPETLLNVQFEECDQISGSDLNALHEMMCMKTYLEALTEFNLWYDRFYHQKPAKPVGCRDTAISVNIASPSTPDTPGGGGVGTASVTPGIRRSARRVIPSSNSAFGRSGSVSNEVAFREKLVYEQEMKTYEAAKIVWEEDVRMFAETAVAHLYEVLTYKGVGWLVDQVQIESDESRVRELTYLRNQCLPLAASMVMAVHSTMDQPAEVLQLADVIADERNALYEVFNKGELQNLLDGFAKNALKLMDS